MELDRPAFDRDAEVEDYARFAKSRADRKFRYELILRMYGTIGFFSGLGAITYFALSLLNVTIDPSQQFTLIIAGASLLLSLMSWLLLTFRKQKERNERDWLKEYSQTMELIYLWSQFEAISRDLFREDDKLKIYSLRSLIAKLHADRKISDNDLRAIQEALELRNFAIHQGGSLPPVLLERIVHDLRRITAKLTSELLRRDERTSLNRI